MFNLEAVKNDVILLSDRYAPAIVDYVLMRAYTKDAEHSQNINRAQLHANNFNSQVGLKVQGDMIKSPNAPKMSETLGRTQ
jgi:hypothetical protein